jgi:hypothetical protein
LVLPEVRFHQPQLPHLLHLWLPHLPHLLHLWLLHLWLPHLRLWHLLLSQQMHMSLLLFASSQMISVSTWPLLRERASAGVFVARMSKQLHHAQVPQLQPRLQQHLQQHALQRLHQ